MSAYYRDISLLTDPTLTDEYISSYGKGKPYDDGDNILEDTAQVIGITAASAVTSVYNGVTGLANWATGSDVFDPYRVEELIPDTWADDYQRSKQSYDVAGEVFGSFIPGTFAVKGARAASAGARGMFRFFDDAYYMQKQSKAYREVLRAVKATDSWYKAEYVNKTLAIGAGRAAVEGAVFELGAYTAINASTDLQNDDVNALDMIEHVGVNILYGISFGAVLGGIGNYVQSAQGLTKRISSFKLKVDIKTGYSDSLLASAPLGSQVTKFKDNISRLEGEIANGNILDSHVATQNTNIDNTLAKMLEDGTNNHNFKFLSKHVKAAKSDDVYGLFTGVEVFTKMRPSTVEEVVKAVPDHINAYLSTVKNAVDHPLVALKNKVAKEPDLVPADVKSWVENADLTDYIPSTMYFNLKEGVRAIDVPNPSLADYGIIKVHNRGSFKDSYMTVKDHASIKWGDSMEGDRYLAKAMFLDRTDVKFPNIRKVEGNIALSEALYLAKTVKNPSRAAIEAPLPRGIRDLDELRDRIVDTKVSLYEKAIERGDGFDKIRNILGIDKPEHLLGTDPEDWITLEKLSTEPTWIRAKVAPTAYTMDVQKAVLWDRRAYSQLEDFAKQAHYEVTGVPAKQMPHIIADDVVAASSNIGATLLRSAPSVGEYGGMEQVITSIGNVLHNVIRKQYAEVRTSLDPTFASMKTDKKAVADFVHARTWMEGQSSDVYLLKDSGGKTYIAKGKVADSLALEETLPDGAISGDEFVELTEKNAIRWANEWHNNTRKIAKDKHKTLSAEGYKPRYDVNAFYLPPKSIKFAAFVYQKDGVGANAKVGILHANSAKELRTKINRLEQKNPEYTIRTIGDLEDYHKATGQLDVSRQFSLQVDKDTLGKEGKATSINPDINAENLILDLDAYLNSATAKNARRATRLYYARHVSILEDLHQRQARIERSGSKEVLDRWGLKNTPASKALKTMLDIPQEQSISFLSEANRSVEKNVSRWFNEAKQLFMDSTGKHKVNILGKDANKHLEFVGEKFSDLTGMKFDDINSVLLDARPDVNRKQLQRFLSRVNGYQATLMLRADGLDGLVNNLSAAILGSTEFKAIMKELPEAQQKNVTRLLTLDSGNAATREVSAVNSVLSGMKLVGDTKARREFIERWKDWNVWESQDEMLENIANIMDDTLDGNMQGLKKATKDIDNAWAKVKKGVFFASDKLNDHAQLQVLHLVDNIGDAAGLTDAQKITMAMTLKSRVLGSTIPSQKPTLFHGAIGTPLGLYQNYNLNVLNALLRYAGDKGQSARFTAMQAGTFGLQGLPGFHQVNTAVHDMYGKEEGADLKSIIDDTVGTRAMKWLLYGSGSGILDGALYTRGDLNPRNQFIFLPSSLEEIPAVNFLHGVVNIPIGTMKDISNGASFGTAFFDAAAHSGINRPMTGIIDAIRGYSTTKYGGLANRTSEENRYHEDASFWRANVARIMGARPLDEALVRERVYRLNTYQRGTQNKLNELGGAITKELLANDGRIARDTVDRFMANFIASGRTPADFEKWYARKVKHYTDDQVKKLDKSIKSGRYYETYKQYFVPQ